MHNLDLLLNNDEIGLVALGGLGEVGKNCYCLIYQNQIFIIDSGILFPDEHLLGVDYVIPDYQFLIDNQEKIVGLFITHGHEDHIGGIPFLLKKVKVPVIYAAGIAVELIESKLLEHKDLRNTKIEEFRSHYTYKFKGIELSFIRLSHSIPDSFAFVFKTEFGSVLHTGDFKFDLTPIGPQVEFEKLTQLAKDGVLCVLSDSTNALLDGFTQSERKVGDSIRDLFSHIEGRIIVATFASNIYRIQQIVEASVENNRKIAIFGRSMEKTIEIGQNIGYIKAPRKTFIDANDINNYPANELTILCTGSQGEPLAALSRVANGSHRQIKLIEGDTVIFSSSPIPGNSEGVNRIINILFKKGANVITHSPLTDTHTSGHAGQGELKMMLSLTKPKYFIPVHGEYRMQKVHGNLGIECGVKKENVYVLENGEVLAMNKNNARISGRVQNGNIFVDGSGIGDIGSSIIKERKMLSDDGLFSLIFTIDSNKNTIMFDPQIVSRGFVYMKESEALTSNILNYAKTLLLNELTKTKSLNPNIMKSFLQENLGKYIYEKTDRKPVIIPIFMLL